MTKTYTTYHGSNEGLDKLLAMAKSSPFPPAGFTIESAQQIAIKNAADREDFIKTHPELGLWQTAVKEPLLKDGGDAYFEMNMKGILLPGGANGVQKFRAKIVSMTPETKPKQIVLALEQPNVPDVTLELSKALPGKMEPARNCNLKESRNRTPRSRSWWTSTSSQIRSKAGPERTPRPSLRRQKQSQGESQEPSQ